VPLAGVTECVKMYRMEYFKFLMISLSTRSTRLVRYVNLTIKKEKYIYIKVKQSRYRPGVSQRVPGS
jgi:hypothetical protein